MRPSLRSRSGSGKGETPSPTTSSTPTLSDSLFGIYPLPAYLPFSPGGLLYTTGPQNPSHCYHLKQITDPFTLTTLALQSDATLNTHNTTSTSPTYLPSLSALANAIFHPLTGVPHTDVREWADAMILTYAPRPLTNITATLEQYPLTTASPDNAMGCGSRRRPCGYVFRRGDIAWNCRTCQTDGTCVLCDECFRNSDHKGHDVLFHRTSPGGCCDCGDPEAWAVEGCCDKHRPISSSDGAVDSAEVDDDFEAVRVSLRGRQEGEEGVKALPERLSSALGVVIGAAVECCVKAVDGAGKGCDPSQWRQRWAEEVCRIWAGCTEDEDYYYVNDGKSRKIYNMKEFLEGNENPPFPQEYRLHLRLHNDDVHTFEEVIDALHDPIPLPNEDDGTDNTETVRLVPYKEDADSMTHKVDSDGQVTVKKCTSFSEAMFGYKRLKSKGLHCSVVSTAQEDMEKRARMLLGWLRDLAQAHPGAMALLTHALVDVTGGEDLLAGVAVWREPRMIPIWCGGDSDDEMDRMKRRFEVFRPYLASSYLTREEAKKLHAVGIEEDIHFSMKTKCDEAFYSFIPFNLPPPSHRQSPHALWGTLPLPPPPSNTHHHPLLPPTRAIPLSQTLYIIDTDLRKQQEAEKLTSSLHPHTITGLHQIPTSHTPTLLSTLRPLLDAASFRALSSALLLLLLYDPYPTKQLRSGVHSLFLSLLIDPRFKSRFAAALGGVAYRPLSTLFCAGVGTESDTPLGFTVQIFTAGSLVRALENSEVTRVLLEADGEQGDKGMTGGTISMSSHRVSTYTLPISRTVIRCIHTNLLGCTKEVKMVVKHSSAADNSTRLPSLAYQLGEHPLTTALPAAPDDGFLDSKTTRHKRLPHLLRDLEYIFETPQTAMRLLLPLSPPIATSEGNQIIDFASAWARLLRLAQGIDVQKRRISGGHVEYEASRWLEAFGLSLNFAGTRDALTESPRSSCSSLTQLKSGMGTLITAILREIKLWLYREGLLETGFPMAVLSQSHQWTNSEASQRSTLHRNGPAGSFALSCATGVKITEAQLSLIEHALYQEEEDYRRHHYPQAAARSALMGDWLRVPHCPLMGDPLSFHLPLHRALARVLKSFCGAVVTDRERARDKDWWKLPLIDDGTPPCPSAAPDAIIASHPLTTLLKGVLRSSNCRVVWTAGPDCTPAVAHARRSRSRAVSSAIAAAKVIHSLCDHPLRCLAAAQQIERHLWARNGSAAAGMAFNYGSPPLCRSFRDLDLTLVQLAAAGYGLGLGPRRTFNLIMSRYSMDGYLCDPVKRNSRNSTSGSGALGVHNNTGWVNPPRMQDPDHPLSLSESFFTTLCLLVTELPPPNPTSDTDDTALRQSMRRELLHALAAESRSHSEAFSAAQLAISPRGDGESGRTAFKDILADIGKETVSRAGGAPMYELRPSCSDEYDPTFYHLRRNEHQHAMDCVARLRKAKNLAHKFPGRRCLPLVTPPPEPHPRLAPARLLMHLSGTDAAIRRALLFALTGGQWLPPPEPNTIGISGSRSGEDLMSSGSFGSVGGMTPRRGLDRSSSYNKDEKEFSPAVVAASSISFLEVLQVITLQIHTLETCAALHTKQELDAECLTLSQSLSIKTYLERITFVPSSLDDCWALRCPNPLPSAGSGDHRGSILGLLIALYEHRHCDENDKSDENTGGKFLASDGLKWLLRFVHALVEGGHSVTDAAKCARDGVKNAPVSTTMPTSLPPVLTDLIKGMISNLPDLWPEVKPAKKDSNDKSKEARKEAQRRAMELMRKQQASFAASFEGFDDVAMDLDDDAAEEEEDICIICRCDDRDGDNNGPLGFLGHVQRSKQLALRYAAECQGHVGGVWNLARVVGDRGCQLRESEEMDSPPVACLPTGSIVEVLKGKLSPKYDLLSRRVYVRHGNDTEGWASVQSSQGYIILSPLAEMCFEATKWGPTRPIIRQCGHAAHLGCVDAHCLSLHQRAAGEQPYDGRFAANIEDGEFLCPLCKQLSNVLVPKQGRGQITLDSLCPIPTDNTLHIPTALDGKSTSVQTVRHLLENATTISAITLPKLSSHNTKLQKEREATRRFGAHLLQAMQITNDKPTPPRQRNRLHPSLRQKWDYDDDPTVGNLLQLLRQQHIAWSALGHSVACAEASARDGQNVEDPWMSYEEGNQDTHPSCLELRRTLIATGALFDVLNQDILDRVPDNNDSSAPNIIGCLLSDILEGKSCQGDQWNTLLCLVKAIPCHVARDGTLPQRNETRAAAAAMWIIKSGNQNNPVPKPLALRQGETEEALKLSWGTLVPGEVSPETPYRPAIAAAFLYTPVLCWDLNTFAGAIYSTLLLNGRRLSADNLILTTIVLLLARLTQILVMPHALPVVGTETNDSQRKESESLSKLQENLLSLLETTATTPATTGASTIYQAASLALLPFSRSLILLLRGTISAMNFLGKKEQSFSSGNLKPSSTDALLQSILDNEKLFQCTDGFQLLKEINGPLPSQIAEEKIGLDGVWFPLMKSWVQSLKQIETPLKECTQSKSDSIGASINCKLSAMEHARYLGNNYNMPPPEGELATANSSPRADSPDGLFNQSMTDADTIEDDDHNGDDDENSFGNSSYASDVEMATATLDNQETDFQQRPDMDDDSNEDIVLEDADNDIILLGLERTGGNLNRNETGNNPNSNNGADHGGSDEDSSVHSGAEDDDEGAEENEDPVVLREKEYGNVGRSAIIPYQCQFLGQSIGSGPRGAHFESDLAGKVMTDLSYFGMVHRLGAASSGLVRLPHSFVELYGLVNRAKGRDNANTMDEPDDTASTAETAICLLTGAIMKSGSARRAMSRSARQPGACTIHARKTGSGIGIFFLVQKCTVLLVHNNKSAYYASLYVDEHGEEDPGLRRGRPLFLKYVRYQALEALWRQHGIPREVAQIRSTSDRVIRDNWY